MNEIKKSNGGLRVKRITPMLPPVVCIALVIAMVFGMAACTTDKPIGPTPTPPADTTPEQVKEASVNELGIISWSVAANAEGYKVAINYDILQENGGDKIFTVTQVDASGILNDGDNFVQIKTMGISEETDWAEFHLDYTKQQEVTKPDKVQNIAIDVDAKTIEWTITPGKDYSYEVSIDGTVIGTIKDDSIVIPEEYLAQGKDYTVSIVTIDGTQRSEPATKGYTVEQQQEQNYKQQIEQNITGQLETYLREGSGYKDINNIQIQKLDVRDSETTNNDEMFIWFTANVTRGTKATDRDFIYRIPLENNYDFVNTANKDKVLADASKEFGDFALQDLAKIESIFNYESINEHVVETLFTLPGKNCDSVLKALQGKTIEMETVTTGRTPTANVSIIAIIDGKMYNISIRNTTWNANSSFAGTIAAIKAGGSNISTSTRLVETFSENSKIYDAMK